MAEPVVSLGAVRRAIGMRSRMPFFMSYGETDVVLEESAGTDVQTSDNIQCASLTQPENFWQNAWVYVSDSAGVYGTERRIKSFEASRRAILPEWPLSAAPATDAHIEIYHMWSPSQIHQAINDAIEMGGEDWPEVKVDETMVLVEDRLTYQTSDVGFTIWKPLEVRVEVARNSMTGQVAGSAAATVTVDSDDDLSGNDTDWFVSIYDGPGKGQVRQFVSADTLTNIITVSTWTTQPTTDSKYRWWDADEQGHDWALLPTVRFAPKEYPDKLYLTSLPTNSYGMRMRITGLKWPEALTADTAECTIPKEYLINKALGILHDSLVGDNRVDRQMHAGTAEYYDGKAEDFARMHRRRVPAGTLWQEEDNSPFITQRGDEIGDPFRWSG